MKKPKKITVKFFLNEHLNDINGNYPLYTQITYDRKNTQIKCHYGGYYRSLGEIQQSNPRLLSFEEQIFKRSVAYELGQRGQEFGLKGLGKKYEVYCLSIHEIFSNYLKMRLRNLLHQARPAKFVDLLNIDRIGIDFFTFYEAALRLFDNIQDLIAQDFAQEVEIYKAYYQLYAQELSESNNYRFPVVIDWLDGTHQAELEANIPKQFPDAPALPALMIVLLRKLVATKLEV